MNVKTFFCATIFSALVAVSCSTNKAKTMDESTNNTTATTKITNQDWQLINSSDKLIKGLFNKQVTLNMDESNSSFYGFSGCNNYNGELEKSGSKISFTKVVSTRMACANIKEEVAFLNVLDKVNRYEVKGKNLNLYKDNLLLLTFKAPQ